MLQALLLFFTVHFFSTSLLTVFEIIDHLNFDHEFPGAVKWVM